MLCLTSRQSLATALPDRASKACRCKEHEAKCITDCLKRGDMHCQSPNETGQQYNCWPFHTRQANTRTCTLSRHKRHFSESHQDNSSQPAKPSCKWTLVDPTQAIIAGQISEDQSLKNEDLSALNPHVECKHRVLEGWAPSTSRSCTSRHRGLWWRHSLVNLMWGGCGGRAIGCVYMVLLFVVDCMLIESMATLF